MRTSLADTPSPADEPHQSSLAALLGLESTADTEEKAPAVVNAALSVRTDVVGRLCAVALQVEAAVEPSGVEPSTTG